MAIALPYEFDTSGVVKGQIPHSPARPPIQLNVLQSPTDT